MPGAGWFTNGFDWNVAPHSRYVLQIFITHVQWHIYIMYVYFSYIYIIIHMLCYMEIYIYIYMFVCICIYIYMCIPIYLHTSCQGHITIFTPHLNEGTQSLFHTCWRNPHTHTNSLWNSIIYAEVQPLQVFEDVMHTWPLTYIIYTYVHTHIYNIIYIILYIYMHLRMSMMIWAFQPQLYPHLKLHCPGLWRRQWGGERWEA